jgi:hypothetical protein
MISITTPIAKTAIYEVWNIRLVRFLGVKKVPPVVIEKTIMITTRAKYIEYFRITERNAPLGCEAISFLLLHIS